MNISQFNEIQFNSTGSFLDDIARRLKIVLFQNKKTKIILTRIKELKIILTNLKNIKILLRRL